jgi:hypothetical protein
VAHLGVQWRPRAVEVGPVWTQGHGVSLDLASQLSPKTKVIVIASALF